MVPAIVDTNVVVAGLLTSDVHAPTARLLDQMLAAAFPFAVSLALLAEYHDVLNRSKLRRRHGLNATEVEVLVTEIAHHAIVLQAVPTVAAPDPGDQHLWNLLAARNDLVLVTGDKRLLQSGWAERICTPQFWLQRLEQGDGSSGESHT